MEQKLIVVGIFQAQTNFSPSQIGFTRSESRVQGNRWQRIANSAILVLGSPRSGTTWLAKIFDSHPDTLYRHEPDELTPATSGLDPAEQVSQWLRHRGLRASAKRPYFRKSWRPLPLENTRRGLAVALAVAQRLPALSRLAAPVGVPDLVVPTHRKSVRGLLKLVNWDGSLAARTMPNARCVFILRHPCGQIASVMAGLASRQHTGLAADRSKDTFARSETREAIASAMATAGRQCIDAAAFDALPDAAKYAWGWRAFNEAAVAKLAALPNARIVLYEIFAVSRNWNPGNCLPSPASTGTRRRLYSSVPAPSTTDRRAILMSSDPPAWFRIAGAKP